MNVCQYIMYVRVLVEKLTSANIAYVLSCLPIHQHYPFINKQSRNYQFYKPPQIKDDIVRSQWNARKSPAQNMAAMGLQSAVNSSIDARAQFSLSHMKEHDVDERKDAIELFDIPKSDNLNTNGITTLKGKTFAQRKLPVSVEDQNYISKCLAKHGDDYTAMFRDTKLNDMQHTSTKLRKMAARFYLLEEEYLRVDIPEKVRHLMSCCKDDDK